MKTLRTVFLCLATALAARAQIPSTGLILDLDADKGIEVTADSRVTAWTNQVEFRAKDFKATRPEGRPTLRTNVAELNGHASLIFRHQELQNYDEDAFDSLITGDGYTWISVMCAYEQKPQLKDVNSFFGNLQNKGNFEGIWGNFNDDGSLWIGSRNGRTFGRWNKDNPKVDGPKLELNRYYLVAGRMADGKSGMIPIELFVNETKAVTTTNWPVNPRANSSKMAIGQERDATNHPGKEAFDGEIARFLLWQRPLKDAELAETFATLKKTYGIK
jgi:hypothetical protein